MLRNRIESVRTLKKYVPLAVAPVLLIGATALLGIDRLQAQPTAVPEFAVPDSVPKGTTINIDGSSSMATINAALAESFAKKFNGTQVNADTSDSTQALQALLKGDIDLAAIGRPLTTEEKAQGLVEVPVARNKIAIFVSQDNPFSKDLKITQFSQIFRGEIADWSELGGTAGPIRFVDRPGTSDTRLAFQGYPVFQSAPFQTGKTADPLTDDTTDAVIKALGQDGIGYALAEQVVNRPDVRILSMHTVLPTDARYPFSQPLAYVYKGPNPSPAVQAFLGYATAPDNQAAIETARQASVTGQSVAAAPATAGDPATAESGTEGTGTEGTGTEGTGTEGTGTEGTGTEGTGTAGAAGDDTTGADPATGTTGEATGAEGEAAAAQPGGFKWWPWLLLPLAGGLLWWLFGRGGAASGAAAAGAAGATAAGAAGAAAAGAAGRVIPPLVGAQDSRIILTARTCKSAYAYWELSDRDQTRLRQLDGPSLMLRLYEHTVRPGTEASLKLVDEYACEPQDQDMHLPIYTDDQNYLVELGYETAEGQWTSVMRSQPIHVPACEPLTKDNSYPSQTINPPTVSSEPPISRLSSDVNADLSAAAPSSSISMPSGSAKTSPPSVLPGSGAAAGGPSVSSLDGNRMTDALSNLKAGVTQNIGTTLAGGAAAAAAGAAVVGGAAAAGGTWLQGDRSKLLGIRPDLGERDKIILVPRDAQSAYAYWEVSESHQQALREAGGRVMKLRIHDVTNIDIDQRPPFSTQEYVCDERDQDRHVPILTRDRDYIADLGYETETGEWLRLIRSIHVRVPA